MTQGNSRDAQRKAPIAGPTGGLQGSNQCGHLWLAAQRGGLVPTNWSADARAEAARRAHRFLGADVSVTLLT